MADFTKSENETTITYTGLGGMSGVVYEITKDPNNLILSVTIPHTVNAQTWEDIKGQLDLKI